MSRSRHQKRHNKWKKFLKQYGSQKLRARERRHIHKIQKSGADATAAPSIKEAGNPWSWD